MQGYDKEKHLKDLEYFMINQNELCNKYRGLVPLLQNATVINAFNILSVKKQNFDDFSGVLLEVRDFYRD